MNSTNIKIRSYIRSIKRIPRVKTNYKHFWNKIVISLKMNKTDLYKDYIQIYDFIGKIQKEKQELVEEFELKNKNKAIRINTKIKEFNRLRKQYLRDEEYVKNKLLAIRI